MHLCIFFFQTERHDDSDALTFSRLQQTAHAALAQVHFLWNEEVIDAINEGVRNSLAGVRAPKPAKTFRCMYIAAHASRHMFLSGK